MHLAELPDRVLLLVYMYAGQRAIARLQLTCKSLYNVVGHDHLWRDLLRREWLGVPLHLSDWAPISSWRRVLHFMNEWGAFEGCFRLLQVSVEYSFREYQSSVPLSVLCSFPLSARCAQSGSAAAMVRASLPTCRHNCP